MNAANRLFNEDDWDVSIWTSLVIRKMKRPIPKIDAKNTTGDEPATTCVTPFFVSEEKPIGFSRNQLSQMNDETKASAVKVLGIISSLYNVLDMSRPTSFHRVYTKLEQWHAGLHREQGPGKPANRPVDFGAARTLPVSGQIRPFREARASVRHRRAFSTVHYS
jgi:hypothetical protein